MEENLKVVEIDNEKEKDTEEKIIIDKDAILKEYEDTLGF